MKIADLENIVNGGDFNPVLLQQIKEKKLFSIDGADCELMEVNKQEKSATFKAVPTEITIDGRAVFVAGVDLEEFDKRKTILWGHYEDILIGRSMWSKKTPDDKTAKNVLVKVEFKTDDFSQEVWEGVRDEWFRFVSPGLMPIESYFYQDAMAEYEKDYDKKPKRNLYYYGRKTLMYELSIVNVPAWSGAVKQKMHLMSDKMKKVLAFDMVVDYLSRVETLENKFSKLVETLGSQEVKTGDVANTLGNDGLKASGDVSKEMTIDVDVIQSIFDKHLKGVPDEKSKAS